MKVIGGYFGLELSRGKNIYHQTHTLKSGRAALHFILKTVNAKKIYIPFYTCDALLQPIEEVGIPFQFYGLDEALDPDFLPDLKKDEYFLYINYFDLKRDRVESLSLKYGAQLIVDCSQAFFIKSNGKSWYFNSCRKFFGAPDGAYLYAPEAYPIEVNLERNKAFTVEHLIKRNLGEVNEGYSHFQANEALCGPELKQMSLVSEDLLSHVDYDLCIQKRNENFEILYTALNQQNLLPITEKGKGVPMAYPFLPEKSISHRKLWDSGLFIPVLWKDVLMREATGYQYEKNLSTNLLALPVDHRYNEDDLTHMIDLLR